MKKATNQNLTQLKKIASKVSDLIKSGQWNALDTQERKSLYATLIHYFNSLKQFFSKRRLSRVLGAASILVTSTASAQNFAAPDTNAFNTQGPQTYFNKVDFADIDNDGDLDLFSNEYYGVFVFQENIGDPNNPNFSGSVVNPFGIDSASQGYTYSTHLTDIDDDGDFDIFATGDYGNVLFFENTGSPNSPSFGPEQIGPFALTDSLIILSDFVDLDGDGDIDIIGYEINYAGSIGFVFIENIGTASAPLFTTPVNSPFGIALPTAGYISYADFADIDFDGDMDMIRTDYYGTAVFYQENIGTTTTPNFGTLTTSPFNIAENTLGGDFYTIAPTFADIDGDGDQDIFVSQYYGSLFYFENIQYQLGLSEDADPIAIEVYPNPSTDVIRVNLENNQNTANEIKIIAVDGKVVYHKTGTLNTAINVADLRNGVYFILIDDKQGKIYKSKFVKQ